MRHKRETIASVIGSPPSSPLYLAFGWLIEFATDSSLEGDGFEPSVPHEKQPFWLPPCGGSLPDVIRTRIMLTDISKWKEAARAHGELFFEIRPACTFVQVSCFIDPDWLVEVEADAIL